MVAGFGTGRGGGGSVRDGGAGPHEDDAGGVGATCCRGRGAAGSDAGERRRPRRVAPGWCVGRGGVQTYEARCSAPLLFLGGSGAARWKCERMKSRGISGVHSRGRSGRSAS